MKILRRKLSKFGKLLTPQEIEEFRSRPAPAFENGKMQNDYDYISTSLTPSNHNDISYLEIKREQLLLGGCFISKKKTKLRSEIFNEGTY